MSGVKVYGLCDANCRHHVLTVDQTVDLIQEMAANGFQVPEGFIPKTAVNSIIEQNSGEEIRLWIGTQVQYDALTIEEKNKLFAIISDDPTRREIELKLEQHNTSLTKILDGEISVPIAQYASSDKTKGTIEERLTKLGFKEGVATFTSNALQYLNGTSSYINLYRQGNYVRGKMRLVFNSAANMISFFGQNVTLAKIPAEFYPLNSNDTKFFIGAAVSGTINNMTLHLGLSTPCRINLAGDMYVSGLTSLPITQVSITSGDFSGDFYFGYEAKPLDS